MAAAWDGLLDLEALLLDRQQQEQHIQLATPFYNAWRDAQDVEGGSEQQGMVRQCSGHRKRRVGSRGDYLAPFLPPSLLVATGQLAERPLTVQEAAETRARCLADCEVRWCVCAPDTCAFVLLYRLGMRRGCGRSRHGTRLR